METFTIWLIWWALALIVCLSIWTINWNRFRKKIKELKEENKEENKEDRKSLRALYEQELKILEKEKDKPIIKLADKDQAHEKQIEEITRNANLVRDTFETEIGILEESISELRSKLHYEQVSRRNNEIAKQKWKKKFETLQITVQTHWFWKELITKYQKRWKEITLAYNKAKKWI